MKKDQSMSEHKTIILDFVSPFLLVTCDACFLDSSAIKDTPLPSVGADVASVGTENKEREL